MNLRPRASDGHGSGQTKRHPANGLAKSISPIILRFRHPRTFPATLQTGWSGLAGMCRGTATWRKETWHPDEQRSPEAALVDSPSLWCSRPVASLLIVLVALCLNLAGNAATGLWDRDEPRYAVAVREMRARGRLALPHLQRRAALSQADPDLLADGPATRWAATTPSGAAGLGAGRHGHRASWSGAWAGACSAPRRGSWPA